MYGRIVTAGFLAFAVHCPPLAAGCADKDEATGVTIEFRDTASLQNVKYAVKMVVEFADGQKPLTTTMYPPAGSSGTMQCAAIYANLNVREGWEQTHKDNKLVLTSWKDPKTGTIHIVKNVTFTSDDMPKAEMPKVILPTKKG